MDYNKITYGQWLRLWLNTYKKPYIKSWKRINDTIRLHIPEYVKKRRLFELTAFEIQKALNGVSSSRMRLEAYNVYHGSLKIAYLNGFIEKDISIILIKPKHVRQLGSALTTEELEKFLADISGHRLEKLYRMYLLTGCRRSELLDLKWSDIDFDNNVIRIRGTKTELSDRHIPLFPDIVDILNQLPYKDGKIFHHFKSQVSHEFKRFCPNHKLHDLRHTFATRCLECGISIKVVQTWLGHARLDTTASIYSHVLPDFFKSESEKFKLT